ncbi:MAG TPA: heavy metal-binding domain-containing protein [Trebonia sp.]
MGGDASTTPGSGGAWDSALSAGDFAALRSVGFEPAGQVFGAAVYYLSTVTGAGCPGTSADQLLRNVSAEASGASERGPATGPRHLVAGPAARVARSLYEGRRTAIDRMAGQCAGLGGHGVVGAALRIREIPATSLTAGAIEFSVMGTAVRASGCPPLTRPFASDLSGQDFAKLIMAGWVPAGIALGISVAGLHDELVTTSSGPWGTGNAEVPSYTALLTLVRQDARRRLKQAVRGTGADGVVVSAMTLRSWSDGCRAHPGGTDRFAEAVTTGTAVAQFASAREAVPPPGLVVLHLDADHTGPALTPDRPAGPDGDRG